MNMIINNVLFKKHDTQISSNVVILTALLPLVQLAIFLESNGITDFWILIFAILQFCKHELVNKNMKIYWTDVVYKSTHQVT